MKSYKMAAALVACLLPWPMKRAVYRKFLQYDISPSAHIGLTFILVDRFSMGDGAAIGHLNVIRGHENLSLGDHSAIGTLNWIGAHPRDDDSHYSTEVARRPFLLLGRHAAITSRHLIDCTGGVSVGEYATVAGFRSQLLTHSIDLERNLQAARGIAIGAYAFVSTAAVLLPGTALPEFSVLAGGSVLTKSFAEPYCLYGGQPARKIKELSRDVSYFTRREGFVR